MGLPSVIETVSLMVQLPLDELTTYWIFEVTVATGFAVLALLSPNAGVQLNVPNPPVAVNCRLPAVQIVVSRVAVMLLALIVNAASLASKTVLLLAELTLISALSVAVLGTIQL